MVQVPDVVIGDPVTVINEGTVTATEVTVPLVKLDADIVPANVKFPVWLRDMTGAPIVVLVVGIQVHPPSATPLALLLKKLVSPCAPVQFHPIPAP